MVEVRGAMGLPEGIWQQHVNNGENFKCWAVHNYVQWHLWSAWHHDFGRRTADCRALISMCSSPLLVSAAFYH